MHRIATFFCLCVIFLSGLMVVAALPPMAGQARAAVMRIANIPLGGVIAINGQKFAKVRNDSANGAQFQALQRACYAGMFDGDDMQKFTPADCNCLPTPTGTNYTLAGTMTDSRDAKSYEVRKFADGKCWMVDNLAYGGVTDACVNKETFDGSANLSGSAWGYGDCRNIPDSSTYGYLYNWQATMQDSSAYYGVNYTAPNLNVQGICPPGWHIPTGNTSGEFQALYTSAGSNVAFWQASGSWKGALSGYCDSAGSLINQGSYGYYWSSTQNSTDYAYDLYFNSSGMYPADYGSKGLGSTVRCIKDTTERTMQNFTTADCDAYPTPSGTGYTPIGQLKDERDGKWYEIRKFADGKCWMVDNLAYGGVTDACVNKETFDGSANLSGSAWGYGDCRNIPGSSTYGYLYNWQATMQQPSAYYGVDYTDPMTSVQGICPSGWHIPTGNTSGEYQGLHTAVGSPSSGFWQGGSWKGLFSGYCDNAGSMYNQSAGEGYWSSTQDNTDNAYLLTFNASGVYSAYTYYKYNGFSVRCVKN